MAPKNKKIVLFDTIHFFSIEDFSVDGMLGDSIFLYKSCTIRVDPFRSYFCVPNYITNMIKSLSINKMLFIYHT